MVFIKGVDYYTKRKDSPPDLAMVNEPELERDEHPVKMTVT